MKRANKSGAAQTVVRSGPDGCWHGTPAQMQEDAEHAEWFFIGRGKRLHAFADGFVAWCGRGPVTVPGHVWVDAEPCRECLKMVRSANATAHQRREAAYGDAAGSTSDLTKGATK